MEKKPFVYRRLWAVVIWMAIFYVPYIFFVPDFLDNLKGISYWIVNILSMLALMYCLWKLMNFLPGIVRTGYYWKDDGYTTIQWGDNTVCLDEVTELRLSDEISSTSRGINLTFRNRGENIDFLSEALGLDTEIEDTVFYDIYAQVLAENPDLEPEKDIFGDVIDYWYKKPKEKK